MTYIVCANCRHVYGVPVVYAGACPVCESEHTEQEAFSNRVLAEAYAVGQWLRDGYSLKDVEDPYFNPRR